MPYSTEPDSGDRASSERAPGLVAAVVVATVAALAAGQQAWSAYGSGAGGEARFYVILAVLMLLTAAFGTAYWWPGRGGVAVRFLAGRADGATEFRARAGLFVLLVVMVACAAALALGAAIEVLVYNEGLPAVSVVLAVLSVPCLAFLTEVARGRIRAGGLVLSPDGIRYRGWFVESYLPWMSVAGVSVGGHGSAACVVAGSETAAWARRRTSKVFPLEPVPDTPRIEVDSRRMAADAEILTRALEFYASHSQHRAELGTPAAAERIRHRDLPELPSSRTRR